MHWQYGRISNAAKPNSCVPTLKSVLPITKAHESPEELTKVAWARASKTDKPTVRTLSGGQMKNIVDATDRWTIGDVDAGVFSAGMYASRYTITKFSSGYMVIDTAA